MPELPTRHLAISASAGSGKTFQLAHRYVRLLAGGVSPARICALTFSRKAAGEIFDSIVSILTAAAGDPDKAAQLGERIALPQLDIGQCRTLLRAFVNTLHRLQIGTLDSFMIGVVRAFPAELGVPPECDIMDGEGPRAEALRQDILTGLFHPGGISPAMRTVFSEAYRQATFEQAGKSFERSLSLFIETYRRVFRVLPEAGKWGRADAIWPTGAAPAGVTEPVAEIGGRLLVALQDSGTPDKLLARWRAFVAGVESHRAGLPWDSGLRYLFEKLAPEFAALKAGAAGISMERKTVELRDAVARDAAALLQTVVAREITGALERTIGLHTILDCYEHAYGREMRRSGRLSFEDAQYLLTAHNAVSGGKRLSRQQDRPGRLYIDYRLDARLDHWLLDEFQDTSDLQWDVLGNLIDEVIQDDSGERSFFYVGDVKQAIYGWRGGNARLFGAILGRYGESIARMPLNASYRSCPAVIETVNRVFGRLEAQSRLPAETGRAWAGLWGAHRCAPSVASLAGAAAILEPVCPDKAKPDSADCYALTAGLINELQPLSRGLDVAVLVRSNAHGKALVDVLRQSCPGMAVVHEGSASIVDNPFVAVMLSALTFAAHPGNTLAWRHIGMTPLAETPYIKGLDRASAARGLLDSVEEVGVTETVRRLGAALEAVQPLDAFGKRRYRELIEACTDFDARPVRGGEPAGAACCDMAVRVLQAHQVQEPAAASAIRVMTVHQSKGLGFDVVILPDLAGSSLEKARLDGLHMARAEGAETAGRWVLSLPCREVASCDSVLREALAAADAAAAFDELCVLYVALTRARRALYMVTRFPGKSSAMFDSAALVKAQLCGDPKASGGETVELGGVSADCLYETGERDWFRSLAAQPAAVAAPPEERLPAGYPDAAGVRTRLARLEPSLQDDLVIPAAALFDAESRAVLRFGSAIHALFEAVEWSGSADAGAIVRAWRQRTREQPDVVQDACDQFLAAMRAPEVAAALARPEGPAELWRERSFEVVLDGQWISGQFDRVTIDRDAAGQAISACITDYKSNRIDDTPRAMAGKTEAYRPQLVLYRRALSRMLAIPESAIRLQLVFTRIGRVAEVVT